MLSTVIAIVVIYVVWLILRWRTDKMGQDKTRTRLANLFVIWSAIFLVASAVPDIPQFWKYAIYVIDTLVFSIIGIRDWYGNWKYKSIFDMRRVYIINAKVDFWFGICIMVIIVIMAFLMTISTWAVYSVDGVEIVTYNNLVSLIFSIEGVGVITYIIYRVRNRDTIMKRWKEKSRQKSLL